MSVVPGQTSQNTASLTALRSALTEAQLFVQLKELENKIKELARSSAPTVPVVAAPPAPATPVAPMTQTVPKESGAPRVVSIQGIDGKRSATIRAGGKLVTVLPGQNFAGGLIVAIDKHGVRLQRGGKTQSLPFEE